MRKLIPPLALALFCLSCDAPFDLSLSQAAAVISKMTLRQTLAPVYGLDGDQLGLDMVFLPEKEAAAPGIDFQNGFLLMRGTYRTVLRYLQFDSAKSSYNAFGWAGEDLINPDPNYHLFLLEPLKFPNPTDSPVGVVRLDPDYPENSEVQILNANFASTSFNSPTGWKNLKDDFINLMGPGPLYDANVVGYSIYPTDFAQPFDDSYWLVRINNPPIDAGKLMEVSMNVSSAALFNKVNTKPGAMPFYIPELAGVERCNYFFDPDLGRGPTPGDRKSYVSWFDTAAGTWKCVRWNGVGIPDSMVLPGITHRIDALLTTGRLFSTEGGIGRVYDSGGAEIASFALGALRFVGERYVGGQPLALFSLARIVTERYSDSLAIDVYSIPTADLETLGK